MFPLFIDLKCRTIGTSRATAEKFYYDQRYISFLRSETTTNVDPPRKPSAAEPEEPEEEEEEEDEMSQAPAVEVPPAGTSGVTSSVQMEEDELVSEEEESINLDQRFEMEMNEMRRHEVQTLTTLPPQTLTIPKIDSERRDGTPETVTPPPEPGDVTVEEVEEEKQACENFRQLQLKIQRLPEEKSRRDLEEELACLKDLIKLCKQIKTISLKNTLSIIVEDGFENSLHLYLAEDLKLCPKFGKDLKLFTKAGLELSTLLHGRNHSQTLEWKERWNKYVKDLI